MGDLGSAPTAPANATARLRAKLRPPAAVPHHVRRGRLHDLLDEAADAPLTLVVAPAGAGKTSLLAAWAAECPRPTAWLSLDETDRDGPHLWRGVVAAVETLAPGCGEGALGELWAPGTVAAAVARLLDDLDACAGPPSVLVIDDAHLVDADATLVATLAVFLQQLPPWLRAVVASRRDLPIPIDRLRARGRLREIRFPDLRFTPDEAGVLLGRLAPALPGDRVDGAVARAGGWAASLQLAALAARRAQVGDEEMPAPSGDDEALVHDYVLREVLAAEDPELVAVMAAVAVVDRVDPGLARAVTGREDAVALLRRAEARGLFVTRSPRPQWFEIHRLVRSALVAEAGAQAPDRLAECHARAARWYEGAGEVVPALDHWVEAWRPREALRLLAAEHAALYDAGHEAVIRRTIAAVPPEVAAENLPAMAEFAWCHLLVDRVRFLELVEQLTWWADRPDTDPGLRPRVTMLQSIGAGVSGRWGDGGLLARQALATMGGAWWRDPLGRFGWTMVARDVALSERWDEGDDDVRQAELALSRDPERRLSFEGVRALGEALAGRPVDAVRVAAAVRRAAAVGNLVILRHELEAAEAVAHRELGDRARALAELEALAARDAGSMVYCRVLAAAELVKARLDAGDVAGARADLRRAEAVADDEAVGSDARAWLARAGTLVALAEGAVGEARRCADLVDDPFWGPVGSARVDLAVGARAGARAALGTAVPRSPRHRVVRALLWARAADGRDEALAHVADAVTLAAASGLLQTVASEGDEVVQLAERVADRVPGEWTDRLRRAAVPAGSVRGLAEGDDPVASLTGRERDVLRLLAGRLTVREIASELYVSPNTLKFHLKTIYRKLGVGSRAEAAAVARRMTALS